MKKIAYILSTVALAFAAVACNNNAAQGTVAAEGTQTGSAAGAIVYFNLDTILQQYDMANDLRSVVETKVNSISQEVNRRQSKLEKDANAFQDKINKGLITQSTAQVQAQKLQEQQYQFQAYAQQKQQEIAEEQQVMMNQIADAIKTYLDEFNADKKYAMILSTSGDILPAPVVVASPELDITDEILAGLNAAYVKSKNQSE